MKKKLGFSVIFFSFMITWIFWLFVKPTRDIPTISQYSQLFAAFALVSLSFINFISTRHKILNTLFNGLDKSYIFHKYLSIFMLIMVLIHNITISMGKKAQILAGETIPRDPYAMYGSFSLYLFILLILIAILAKKLNYDRWKIIHKFMLIPYAFGIYHYYGSSDYAVLSLNPFSIWLNIVNFVGILSIFYSLFFYEKTSFKYHFKINKLEIVAKETLEITGNNLGNTMPFEPGQFAFLKTVDKNNNFSSHPFTISQAPKPDEIQFTIKALGDDTNELFNTLKVGDEFLVSGPHGTFNYKSGCKNQIWIAGGIGITPFRSFLQAGIANDYLIDIFYTYNDMESGAYIDELQSLTKNNNLKLHLYNSKESGFLSVEEICKYADIEKAVDIYFCGPKPMRESLQKQFKNSKLNVLNFHFEHFQFK